MFDVIIDLGVLHFDVMHYVSEFYFIVYIVVLVAGRMPCIGMLGSIGSQRGQPCLGHVHVFDNCIGCNLYFIHIYMHI
jgi:hypothetical protein